MFTQHKGQNKEMLRWLVTERLYWQQTLTNGYILNSAATRIHGNKIWAHITSLISFKDTTTQMTFSDGNDIQGKIKKEKF